MEVKIVQANKNHLEDLVPLFDAYRVFYKQSSDFVAAKQFLTSLFDQKYNIVYIAYLDGNPVGFTQLYPSYSSVSMQSFYILNDLYVMPQYRGKAVATKLLNQAKIFAQSNQLKGLLLETALDNPAQKLYERLDWKKVNGLYYFWKNN